MRYRMKIGVVAVVVALVQLSAPESMHAAPPAGWAEVKRFPISTSNFLLISSPDAAIGPDGRWHEVVADFSTCLNCTCPFVKTSAITYRNEAGEQVQVATGQFVVSCDGVRPGNAVGGPVSVSVNARGDVLIGYVDLNAVTGTAEHVLLRRTNQLQRWEGNGVGMGSAKSETNQGLAQFAPAYPIDVQPGRIDPNKPTVVLVHGWNPGSHVSLNVDKQEDLTEPVCERPMGSWRCLANAISSWGVNVLAWDWLYEARSWGDGVHEVPGDAAYLQRQATLLLQQLRGLLGGGGQPIQLIGHSLGASVVADVAAESSPADGIERVTLLDAVENKAAGFLDAPRQNLDVEVIPDIPNGIAIDNYFSLAGCGYDGVDFRTNGVNVNLRMSQGRYSLLHPLKRLAKTHSYPKEWYLATVEDPTISVVKDRQGNEITGEHAGWWWSTGGGNNPSSATDWVDLAAGKQGNINPELQEAEEPSRCDRIIGTGNQGFVQGTWDQSGTVQQIGGLFILSEGSPAAISQTVSLDPQAAAIQFEYLFENGGDGDALTVSWDQEVLWRRVGSEFAGPDFLSSGLVDISAHRGTTGVLQFTLESVGQPNAVVMLRALEFSESSCPDCFDLTVIARGQGMVDPMGGLFPAGTSVQVAATPAVDWRFNRWEVDGTEGWQTARTINLVMDAHRSVLSVFAPAHPGDPTQDGDADLADVAAFQRCFGLQASGVCSELDLAPDGMIDLDDLVSFDAVLSGPYP